MNMQPQCLSQGDTIGLVAPCHVAERERYAPILDAIRSLGFQVRLGDHFFRNTYGYLASEEERAEDINSMAREKEVKMVLFGGGEGGEEVLPYLDYSAIRAHPKFYVSYSDGTSILSAITRKTGLVTYYGALPGMFENLTPYNKQQFFSHFVEGPAKEFLPSAPWRLLCPADWDIVPEIMIPLVGEVKELKFVKKTVTDTADRVIAEAGSNLKYKVGTMIEIPRAALTADKIAEEAEFFSFGTNDLTQMTFGFSRDDAGKFLNSYYENKIYENDPFARLDQEGVGQLVKMAAEKGKSVRPDIVLGICGEHGGDPTTIEFCHNVGLTYVSCSPFRVPIARLAAAQAAIKNPRK